MVAKKPTKNSQNDNQDSSLSWTARAEAIDNLISAHKYTITSWERDFLESVRNRISLTPKQIDCLNGVFHKYTGEPLIDTGIEYPPNWNTPKSKAKGG